MPLPQPEGFEDRFLALERKVNDLFTSIQNSGGFTTASTGLIFPNRATPATPADGGHLHAQGDDPYWTDSSGSTVSLIPPPPPTAGYVSDPSSPSIPTPTGDDAPSIGALTSYVSHLRSKIIEMRSSLVGGGVMNPP